jgi:hypothetical protein
MICDKDILQVSFYDLNQSVSPEIQLTLHKLSKSAPLTDMYVQAVCYKTYSTGTFWPLEAGLNGYSKTLECSYHFMLHTIPEGNKSQNLFNMSVPFHQGMENSAICTQKHI